MKWAEVSARAGRNDMPALLAEAVAFEKTTDPREIAKGVADAWTMAEWPAQYLDPAIWTILFDRACSIERVLTDEGATKGRETLPEWLTLWRGAIEGNGSGMSWTTEREQAEWFAHRLDRPGSTGRLYTATVSRDIVLAVFDARREAEVVIDPDYLMDDDVQEVE